MIRDITFGQFFPAKSPIHALDPRTKLVLVVAYIVMVFIGNNFFCLGLARRFSNFGHRSVQSSREDDFALHPADLVCHRLYSDFKHFLHPRRGSPV